MWTSKPHGMKRVFFVTLILLSIWILVHMYITGRASRDQDRFVAGSGSCVVSQRLVKIPVFAFFPTRFLNREVMSISRELNASVLKSVFEVFNPSLRSFLTSVPIVLDPSADTAKAYRTKGYIGVSPDWDNTALQSQYRTIYEQRGMKQGDPVFMDRFKTDLLIHEFLHILQVHQGIDGPLFYETVARWYIDPRYGIPSPSGMIHTDVRKDRRPHILATNRMKYIVWYQLYNYRRLSDVPPDESWKNMQYGERYRSAEKGVEEFAYIGEEILSSGSSSENYLKTGQWSDKDWESKKRRMSEISPEVMAVFKDVFNPLLAQ